MSPVITAQDRSSTDLAGDSTVQDRSAFVSVAEAARLLKISTATVKRRIRDGTLEAEPLSRPQSIEYRVRLPRDVTPALMAPASDVPAPIRAAISPLTERSDSEQTVLTGSAHGTTQDISAAITAAVAPLMDRLTVQDATIARQAETIQHQADAIAELREERGRHTAELERAASTIVTLAEERDALRAPPQLQAPPGTSDQPAPTTGGCPGVALGPPACPGTVAARRAGDRCGGRAAGVAEVISRSLQADPRRWE
jgi:hypothetical protein